MACVRRVGYVRCPGEDGQRGCAGAGRQGACGQTGLGRHVLQAEGGPAVGVVYFAHRLRRVVPVDAPGGVQAHHAVLRRVRCPAERPLVAVPSGGGGGEPGLREGQRLLEAHEFDDHQATGGQPVVQPSPQQGPCGRVEVAEDPAEQHDTDPVGEVQAGCRVRGDRDPGAQIRVAEHAAGEHGAHAGRGFAGDDLRVRPGAGDGLGHQARAGADVHHRTGAQVGLREERGDGGDARGRGVPGRDEVEELRRRAVGRGVVGAVSAAPARTGTGIGPGVSGPRAGRCGRKGRFPCREDVADREGPGRGRPDDLGRSEPGREVGPDPAHGQLVLARAQRVVPRPAASRSPSRARPTASGHRSEKTVRKVPVSPTTAVVPSPRCPVPGPSRTKRRSSSRPMCRRGLHRTGPWVSARVRTPPSVPREIRCQCRAWLSRSEGSSWWCTRRVRGTPANTPCRERNGCGPPPAGSGAGSAKRQGRRVPSACPRMSTSGCIRWTGVAASTKSGRCRATSLRAASVKARTGATCG